jgi:hypothetical protein
LAFGGASLQNFAFALLVGICSGGYHSIFYSAPLVNVLRERQMKSASFRRAAARQAALERPRTVAEAKAQAATSNLSREEILRARKERRRKATAGRPAGPARYKRKRVTPADGSALQSGAYEAEALDDEAFEDGTHEAGFEHENFEHENFEYEVDPLDAQNAGLHDRDLALGHEEIHLNLDDEAEPHAAEPPAPARHE